MNTNLEKSVSVCCGAEVVKHMIGGKPIGIWTCSKCLNPCDGRNATRKSARIQPLIIRVPWLEESQDIGHKVNEIIEHLNNHD